MFKYIVSIALCVISLSANASYFLNLEQYKKLNRDQKLFFVLGVHDSFKNCTPDLNGSEYLDSIDKVLLESPAQFNGMSAANAVKAVTNVSFKCIRT